MEFNHQWGSGIDCVQNFSMALQRNTKLSESMEVDGLSSSSQLRKFLVNLDHVIENICGNLNRKDLLNLRLVSGQFSFIASKLLRTQVTIHFDNFELGTALASTSLSRSHLVEEKTLEELTQLLKQPHVYLPCSKFYFISTCESQACQMPKCIGSNILQKFLRVWGSQITFLHLCFGHLDEHHWLPEAKVIKIVKKILGYAENLETLVLSIDCVISWKQPVENNGFRYRSEVSPLLESDEEFRAIHSQSLRKLNRKLKRFECYDDLSSKLLEEIIISSPHLNEIVLQGDENSLFFLKPLNRTHLLKDLYFIPSKATTEVFENITSSLKTSENQLRQFSICLANENFIRTGKVFAERVANIVNEVLEMSKNSLESINWFGVIDGPNIGIQFPSALPRLNYLKLGSPIRIQWKLGKPGLMAQVENFKISKQTKLPKLRTVGFYAIKMEADLLFLIRCLDVVHYGSVKLIETDCTSLQLSEKMINNVKEIFVNARVDQKYFPRYF